MNRLLLPPWGSTIALRDRVDERGIPVPSWWSDDESDSTIGATAALALQLKRGPRR